MLPQRPIQTTDSNRILASEQLPLRGRSRDTVISPPTPAENAEWSKRMATMSGFNGGTMWQGDLQPVGEAVARVADALRRVKGGARQKDALSQAVVALANFGNTLGNSEADLGPADVLSFEGNDELTLSDVHEANGIKPDPTTSEGARAEVEMNRRTGDAINAANAKAWANAKFVTDAVPRDAMAAKIQDMNRSNADFWAKQTAHQRTPPKEWGKG
jgi:hypothetical protein